MKRFALAGNPNCGKTTLFNNLTGSTAYVGNWPGVTVDKREGTYKKLSEPISIVDLPGIYSLSPYTPEEVISRNYILDEKPDCVINIVDTTNLERNLYLTTQLLEIDVPMVLALNMMDLLSKNKESVLINKLEKELGIPVVEISALKEDNLDLLMQKAYEASNKGRKGKTVLEDTNLYHLINDCRIAFEGAKVKNPLFHAVKLVELDELETEAHPNLVHIVEEFKHTFNDDVFGNDFEALIADARYKYISKHFHDVIVVDEKEKQIREAKTQAKIEKANKRKGIFRKKKSAEAIQNEAKLTLSDKIDKVLTNRFLGIPIFLIILFVIFHLTFSEDLLYLNAMGAVAVVSFADAPDYVAGMFVNGGINSPGVILMNAFNALTGWIGDLINQGLTAAGASNWSIGLVCDGIFGGLFAVLGFLPQILVLFLFFAILEDSGYMARVAFILDRIFRRFGLSGRAFMPMIMGFGCSVPAMINTRTLADDKERISTIRVIPFFSCGAKAPILTVFAYGIISIFGEAVGFRYADVVVYGMYVLGMAVALITVIMMRETTLRGKVPPFIMELPAYHLPQFKSLMIHLWDKLKHFIEKAFTIILISTIVIWFLQSFTFDWKYIEYDPETLQFLGTLTTDDSILAGIGKLIQPLFTPLGFGSQLAAFGWVFAVGAITGLIAKENVIATFGMLAAVVGVALGSAEGEGVNEVVAMVQATNITIPALISFIAFNMLTIPCFAAVATAKAELKKGTLKYTIAFWLIVSYTVSSLIYTVGSWWWTSFIWVGAIALIILGIYLYNKKISSSRLTLKRG